MPEKKYTVSVENGAVQNEGRTFRVPGFTASKLIGQGANGYVVEAHDDLLQRPVAIKFWNSKGNPRAHAETIKMANFNHPNVVTTYQFDYLDRHPYSIMELVPGITGKDWLKNMPPVDARIHFWIQYSAALRYIHDLGHVHGDPHLGNVLINFSTTEKAKTPTLKIADAGTSRFWKDRGDLLAREKSIIEEVFEKLFPEYMPSSLIHRSVVSDHIALLKYLNIATNIISNLNSPADSGYGIVASGIVQNLLFNPIFDLETILKLAAKSGATTPQRISRRLNAGLLLSSTINDAPDFISNDTFKAYDDLRQKFMTAQSQGIPFNIPRTNFDD